MLVGVAPLPLSFLPSGTQAFYIVKRPNCLNICDTVYVPLHFVYLSKQAMEWLSRQTEIEVEFVLYDLVFLFQQLVTTAPIDAPSRMTLGAAESHLTRDVFLYLPSMSCKSHRSMESCKCAGARASRCAFIICDFCCQMYGKFV